MRIIVCDAGPIIHLHEADILSLLKHMGKIFLPNSVSMEVLTVTDIGDKWPKWLRVVRDVGEDRRSPYRRIGSLCFGQNAKSRLVADR